ncbi:MAG: hypothetical protein IIA45_10210 [Bacteroidetes bacterium]|nr:hypothetical protein [Bacteroidota bacterium]
MMKRIALLLVFTIFIQTGFGQGVFSGDLSLNGNFYQRDSLRGAAGTPHYDNLFSGADSWLNINYRMEDFNAGMRFDLFNSSALHNPTQSYSDEGIGAWYVRKKVDKLTISGGYIYGQVGSGIIFRAYEERGLGIDNALIGIGLEYEINDNWGIKVMTGRQKDLFTTFSPILKVVNLEGAYDLTKEIRLLPGVAFVNRTLDQGIMDDIVNEINLFALEDRFVPKYNMYAYSFYNTLNYKGISWTVEYAGKSTEAIRNISGDSLLNKPGSVIYSDFTYSQKGLGVTLQYRRVENFSMKISPYETLLQGLLNFLPAFSKQNTYRLVARYSAVAQDLGEMGYQADVVWTPKKGYTIMLNMANVVQFTSFSDENTIGDFLNPASKESSKLFTEINGEFKMKPNRNLMVIVGGQYILYNQEVYEVKPTVALVNTITPFTEISYKLSRKKSLRMEFQYMDSEQDFGSWMFALLEYNIAPSYSFALSDMYNIDPKKTGKLHYPTVSASFTHKATKLILGYVKQVEGIVCTGGVCRFEPAFSGIKFILNSSF